MLLKDFMKQEKISQATLGKKINISRSSISTLLSSNRFPNPIAIKKIEIFSNGKVTANDFMKQHEESILKSILLEEKKEFK